MKSEHRTNAVCVPVAGRILDADDVGVGVRERPNETGRDPDAGDLGDVIEVDGDRNRGSHLGKIVFETFLQGRAKVERR